LLRTAGFEEVPTLSASVSNPWVRLPLEAPYVLAGDEWHVQTYNATGRGPEVELDIPAEPFLGWHDAPVVLLQANPGSDPGDREMYRRVWAAHACRQNLTAPGGAPIYLLADQVADTSAGGWWRNALKGLLPCGLGYRELAEKILVVQIHGYHSHPPSELWDLPSQAFGIALVRAAMKRNAVIIVASRHWYVAVATLDSYRLLVTKISPQTRALSRGNLGERGFEMVCGALRST
jgi:hypothetical protein